MLRITKRFIVTINTMDTYNKCYNGIEEHEAGTDRKWEGLTSWKLTKKTLELLQ